MPSSWWLTPPFGPLNGIHGYALKAEPLTLEPSVVFEYWILPVLPVFLQAWLLLGEQNATTRAARKALAGVAVALIWKAAFGYRLVDYEYNAFNTGLLMFHLHNTITSLEFGFLHDRLVDPWMQRGRGRLQAAGDLIVNTRMLFLGDVGLDRGQKLNASIIEPQVERHLVHLHRPSTSRAGAIMRHLAKAATMYIFDHTCFAFLNSPELTKLGLSGDGILTSFVETTAVEIPLIGVLPPWLLRLWVQLIVFLIVYASLSLVYHTSAVISLLLGWEVETWDLDIMHRPWAADSLTDLWGRRWHQVLRHHFVILSAFTCRVLCIPQTRATMVPLAFFYSCVAHVLGELNMSPVPTPWKIGSFFLLNGVGCLLEGMFTMFTGRKVRGPYGRIWFLIALFTTSRLACEAWLDAGMAGCTLLPHRGPGEYIAPRILSLIDITPRT